MSSNVPPPTVTPGDTGSPAGAITPPAAGVAGPSIDPKDFEKAQAEIGTLRSQKINIDRDNEKLRKANKELAEKVAAANKALGITDPTEDPRENLRKQEEQRRESDQRTIQTNGNVLGALLRNGLLPKDNDPDYLLYRLGKDPELQSLASEGNIEGLVGRLKEKGMAISPATAPAATPPPQRPNMPGFAAPAPTALPMDRKFQEIEALPPYEAFRKLVAMGESVRAEYEKKYPEKFKALAAGHQRVLTNPRMRAALVAKPQGPQGPA